MHIERATLATYARLFVGRRTDYAIQTESGRYRRAFSPLNLDKLYTHLAGNETLATYLINEAGQCHFAVFDCDLPDGLNILAGIQQLLATQGMISYLEGSRRGGHLWIFFDQAAPASQIRAWLLPYCSPGVEFYPKQNESLGVGSLIRLPLGVHRLSGKRYPFVTQQGPVASNLREMLAWLTTIERNPLPEVGKQAFPQPASLDQRFPTSLTTQQSLAKKSGYASHSPYTSIRDWTEVQDALRLISRYVSLDRRGLGCCPFGEHHSDGKDSHPSFRAYQPLRPGASSWYCYAWQRGGNVFDFLCLYHGLEAAPMWSRIQAGDVW